MDEQQHDISIDELKKQNEEYLAGWKRAQADYQNLLKDAERAKSENIKFANEKLILELIPSLEHLDETGRQFKEVEDQGNDRIKNCILGFRAVQREIDRSMEGAGLKRIDDTGEFNPQKHEAIGAEESSRIQSGYIIRTVSVGWILNGKILKPARVIIKK